MSLSVVPLAKAFGVLGTPIGHSRSPAMHNAAFQILGLAHRYFAFEVAPESLSEAMAGARALGVGGLNITVPHKREAARYCDWLSEPAARIGAVNTIWCRGTEVQGYNTDAPGFIDAVQELGGPLPAKAVVLGGGGAARAVVDALLHRDPPCDVTWISRTPSALPAWAGARRAGYEHLTSALEGADLLVNTTTVGMKASGSVFPVAPALERLASAAMVVDLVYPRPPGGLLDVASKRGLRVQDGRPMLLWQGIRALELWLGFTVSDAVRDAMRAALYA